MLGTRSFDAEDVAPIECTRTKRPKTILTMFLSKVKPRQRGGFAEFRPPFETRGVKKKTCRFHSNQVMKL